MLCRDDLFTGLLSGSAKSRKIGIYFLRDSGIGFYAYVSKI